ncbi:hypothetical protein HELRODRAFT_189916 [Helobdella robusta]|uniref:Cyclin-like domain-containing protein n=1 Tax=Helobdella robusta TaxID=6412 RepID=T1FRH5_HELRO|nr:hypothetical protein HELRODRAFT_189916 [Helobdella robusta]ESN90608.1 hypothetical protein HELRODRAFT_189916 [Helobdella robusta]
MIKSPHALLSKVIECVQHESLNWTNLNYRTVTEQDKDDICGFHRNQCVQWLTKLNRKFNFHHETLFLAVHLLDKFLLKVKTKVKYLRCAGLTCLYISAKFNEENEDVPTTKHLVDVSGCGYSVAEVVRMEVCLLQYLNWNVSSVTSFEYLTLYHALLTMELESKNLCGLTYQGRNSEDLLSDATTLLTGCLAHQDMLNYPPSVLALAVLSYLVKKLKYNVALNLIKQFRKFIKVNSGLLRACKSHLSTLLPHYATCCKFQLATLRNMRSSSLSDSDASDDDDDFSDYFENLDLFIFEGCCVCVCVCVCETLCYFSHFMQETLVWYDSLTNPSTNNYSFDCVQYSKNYENTLTFNVLTYEDSIKNRIYVLKITSNSQKYNN